MRKITLCCLILLCLLAALLLSGCGDGKELVIQEGVTEIKDGAYRGRGFETVSIPASVTRIGASAFENCRNLKTIVIPASVTKIGSGAFRNCENLSSAELPEGLREIGEKAFEKCKALTSVMIPASVAEVGEKAFGDCAALAEITLNGETKISSSSFAGCEAVSTLTVRGSSLDSNTRYAIWHSKALVSVTLPDGLTAIGKNAFAGCEALHEIAIPDSVTAVADSAFERTSLVKDALAMIPADFGSARELPAPLGELTAGKRILPVNNGTLFGSLYTIMPAALRTCNGSEADFVLTTNIIYQERHDYSGSAFNTCTGVYLCAKDGAVYHVDDIWHTPSLFGLVQAGSALRGDVAYPREIWESVENKLNDTH